MEPPEKEHKHNRNTSVAKKKLISPPRYIAQHQKNIYPINQDKEHTLSWNTKQDSNATHCCTDRSLKAPLNIISVRSSSSPLYVDIEQHTHTDNVRCMTHQVQHPTLMICNWRVNLAGNTAFKFNDIGSVGIAQPAKISRESSDTRGRKGMAYNIVPSQHSFPALEFIQLHDSLSFLQLLFSLSHFRAQLR